MKTIETECTVRAQVRVLKSQSRSTRTYILVPYLLHRFVIYSSKYLYVSTALIISIDEDAFKLSQYQSYPGKMFGVARLLGINYFIVTWHKLAVTVLEQFCYLAIQFHVVILTVTNCSYTNSSPVLLVQKCAIICLNVRSVIMHFILQLFLAIIYV